MILDRARAIADLYPEDDSFHGEGFAGYKGFDPEELSGLLKKPAVPPITRINIVLYINLIICAATST
jgi:hypothetical protein